MLYAGEAHSPPACIISPHYCSLQVVWSLYVYLDPLFQNSWICPCNQTTNEGVTVSVLEQQAQQPCKEFKTPYIPLIKT